MLTSLLLHAHRILVSAVAADVVVERGETGQWPACSREFRNTYVISLRRKGFVTFNKHMRFYN